MPSNIEWTGESWNPIRARTPDGKVGWHCEHASPGCQHCYAETQNIARRFDLGTGLPYKPGHRKDAGTFLDEAALLKPLGWKEPRTIFVCSMTDLFADFVTDAMIDRVFAVMALCPQHTFQVLTKRSARMREYLSAWSGDWSRTDAIWEQIHRLIEAGAGDPGDREIALPFPNVWLGVSVEDQQRADERIPDLLATPAALRWISAEPLLGPVDLRMLHHDGVTNINALTGDHGVNLPLMGRGPGIDWVVAGGESGKDARPMHPDWPRALRNQCAAADVPFFFKQWGEFGPVVTTGHNDPHYPADPPVGERMDRVGKKHAGRLLDGVLHDAMPGQTNA